MTHGKSTNSFGSRNSFAGAYGKGGKRDKFFLQQAINIVTSYTDEIPTGEAAKNTMTILIKTLKGNSLWPEASIITELGPIVSTIERFSDEDVQNLGEDKFWAESCYDLLTEIATKDDRVQANLGKLLSSQKFNPSDRLLWVLAILSCLISGDAPFNRGCLGQPASLKTLGGRLTKLALCIKTLTINLPAITALPSLSESMRSLILTCCEQALKMETGTYQL